MLFPRYFETNPNAELLVRESLAYMLQITPTNFANLPCATDEANGSYHRPESEALIHWCHGSPGAVLAYARAYILWKDGRYLAECRRCAELIWHRGLLKKGPGICHGVAGNAYIFLLMYRLTGEAFYLHRCAAFARFMQMDAFKQARRPDCPYSLFEGLAGTACFYADLSEPATGAFPLMDPFWDVYTNPDASRPVQ
ncbi:unnamed protein product [Dicrocoelium dendriticum]|nr:unnamed protein product [Dicrocoelium dendriticum]